MSHTATAYDQLKFDESPSTQEFLDEFLSVLEEQYSYERLEGLPASQLDLEVKHANNDLDVLRWRLKILENNRITQAIAGRNADLENSVELELPTLDQIHQINWTVIQIERNINKAIADAKRRDKSGIFPTIKRIFVGADNFGGIEIERLDPVNKR